jgi:single-stranded-DNA-specific exonuclease
MERQQPAIFEESFLVLYQSDWHPGLLGVIAAKMVVKYQKPCLVCTLRRGTIQGSARSTKNLDIQQFFEGIISQSIQSGGHAMAAGIQFHPNEFESIRNRMLSKARRMLDRLYSGPKQIVHAVLEINDIDALFWAKLQKFAPFGPENKRPIFVLKGIQKTSSKRLLGQTHIKFCLDSDLNKPLAAIAFNQYKYWNQLQSRPVFDLCFVVEQQQYKDRTYLQLNVKDMSFAAFYA